VSVNVCIPVSVRVHVYVFVRIEREGDVRPSNMSNKLSLVDLLYSLMYHVCI